MRAKKYFKMSLWFILLVLWLTTGLMTACTPTEAEVRKLPEIHTQLLVRAPDGPLPTNKSVSVRSLTEAETGVSHVELYAVELPTGQRDVLIRSDPAPSAHPPSFTLAQLFTPLQPGHYVIKVVGYNSLGQAAESDYLGFDIQ
jgi:hypothetical protein